MEGPRPWPSRRRVCAAPPFRARRFSRGADRPTHGRAGAARPSRDAAGCVAPVLQGRPPCREPHSFRFASRTPPVRSRVSGSPGRRRRQPVRAVRTRLRRHRPGPAARRHPRPRRRSPPARRVPVRHRRGALRRDQELSGRPCPTRGEARPRRHRRARPGRDGLRPRTQDGGQARAVPGSWGLRRPAGGASLPRASRAGRQARGM